MPIRPIRINTHKGWLGKFHAHHVCRPRTAVSEKALQPVRAQCDLAWIPQLGIDHRVDP